MCTAIISVGPGPTVLLAGVRDEFLARAWEPPGRHWPQYPDLIGGQDLIAGGTWLAVAPAARRFACVLNGRGPLAPAQTRQSRGVLPLVGAAKGKLAPGPLATFDPFHLLIAEPGRVSLTSWNGAALTERTLAPGDPPDGLYVVVNNGLADDLLAPGQPVPADAAPGRDRELARLDWFVPRLRSAARPHPEPGGEPTEAWGDWLPLLTGAGLDPGDPRALIVRHDFGGGRVWGTTSVSLVALTPRGLRYDFSDRPGEPGAWSPVPLG